MNWESSRDELRRTRNIGSRESEKTLRLGKVVLADSPSKLGDEGEKDKLILTWKL